MSLVFRSCFCFAKQKKSSDPVFLKKNPIKPGEFKIGSSYNLKSLRPNSLSKTKLNNIMNI